jgi:hypothetical protein
MVEKGFLAHAIMGNIIVTKLSDVVLGIFDSRSIKWFTSVRSCSNTLF